jgi:hypothetical protein
MRQIILTICLVQLALAGLAQEERNGDIYIKHPYIEVVKKSVKAYLDRDIAANTKIFADTAKFWVTGMPKPIPIAEALKMWSADFNYFDSITLKVVGYPDYLAYKDQDAKLVQSWWTWYGKSKKSGEKIRVDLVQFDSFNKDGKIDFESLYGNFDKMIAEEK